MSKKMPKVGKPTAILPHVLKEILMFYGWEERDGTSSTAGSHVDKLFHKHEDLPYVISIPIKNADKHGRSNVAVQKGTSDRAYSNAKLVFDYKSHYFFPTQESLHIYLPHMKQDKKLYEEYVKNFGEPSVEQHHSYSNSPFPWR